MNDRTQLRNAWLTGHCSNYSNITALPADASFRRYFRITTPEENYLLMDAPPELEDSHSFVAITKAYRHNGIHTPEIFAEDLTQGFLLLEDFGDALLNPALNENTASKLYRQCYEILPAIQSCQNIPNWTLPNFVNDLLDIELNNFKEWCILKFAELQLTSQEENLLAETFAFLKNACAEQPQVGVHRDYHSRNLMIVNDQTIGVIDFQDAVIGPLTYDLVSLLRDCYINWPVEQVYVWVKDYYDHFADHKKYSFEKFCEWFDLQGLQRHLKAIFIFCRKYLRDGSTYYLNDIRRTLQYVLYVSSKYPKLQSFHQFVENRLANPLLARIKNLLESIAAHKNTNPLFNQFDRKQLI